MTISVGIGNKYTILEDAIKNDIRNILITSNMHVKNTILLNYGKYNITIANSCLLYIDVEDICFTGKEFATILIEGGTLELRCKNISPDNITCNMRDVSITCNGTVLNNVDIRDSIISGDVTAYNCLLDNVTVEGEITSNNCTIRNSRLRDNIIICQGNNSIDNSYIKNIKTIDNTDMKIYISNSTIYGWLYNDRATKLRVIIEHSTLLFSNIPSLDNSIIRYNSFKNDINILYVYNSTISHNNMEKGNITIEFLRNSKLDNNIISVINVSHESSDSYIRNNISDTAINVTLSKNNKISCNITSNMSLDTLEACKIKRNKTKNIIIKYLLQSSLSYHTGVNMQVMMSIDSKLQYNTHCNVDIKMMSRSYYIGNYIDSSDVININKPTMSTISSNKSYEYDTGYIHIYSSDVDNIIQDNCNIIINQQK